MISGHELYMVLSAVVPLYLAMALAYVCVRWWGVFTPDQCSGINRFVAIIAVPLLSFHFISTSDPYAMNFRFLAADTLQKVFVLAALALSPAWARDWFTTLFSVSSLPNTLIMGIPLLVSMYGTYSGELMVQIVVAQSIIWYTLLLFLFELRAALVPTAAQVASVHTIESDVVSLDGSQAHSEWVSSGSLHVNVSRSWSSSSSMSSWLRPSNSNLNDVEMYSVSSSRNVTLADDVPEGFDDHAVARARASATVVPSNDVDPDDLHVLDGSSGASGSSAGVPLGGAPGGERASNLNMDESGEDEQAVMEAGLLSNQVANDAESAGGQQTAVANGGGGDAETAPAGVVMRVVLTRVWRRLTRNPNTYASLLGLIWLLIKFRFNITTPIILDKSISILSDAGLGMAMFSLGLFWGMQPSIIACRTQHAVITLSIRFLLGPVVMAGASLAVGLRDTLLHIAIVQAALPQGIVAFVFAREYSLHASILSTGVIFGMMIALPITLLYYFILGRV